MRVSEIDHVVKISLSKKKGGYIHTDFLILKKTKNNGKITHKLIKQKNRNLQGEGQNREKETRIETKLLYKYFVL